jgi:transcriptional regulator with XRE-family HTH domain
MKAMYLKTLREMRGLKQEQLVKLAGVAQPTISRLERDAKARPIWATVRALARALHVAPDQLRFGPDPQARPKARVA